MSSMQKNYELTDMLIKIDTLWVQGSLMEQQRTELISLARQNADPAASYAPLQDQIDTYPAYWQLVKEANA